MNRKRSLFISLVIISSGLPLTQAEELTSFSQATQRRIASNSIESSSLERELDIKNQLLSLSFEQQRLQNVRKEVILGNLSARGFQDAISSEGRSTGKISGNESQGLVISDVDQGLLKSMFELEKQLANARLIYQPNSKRILSLEARYKSLLPLIKKNQIDAVDNAINLNKARIVSIRKQEKSLVEKFKIKPELIKEYEESSKYIVNFVLQQPTLTHF